MITQRPRSFCCWKLCPSPEGQKRNLNVSIKYIAFHAVPIQKNKWQWKNSLWGRRSKHNSKQISLTCSYFNRYHHLKTLWVRATVPFSALAQPRILPDNTGNFHELQKQVNNTSTKIQQLYLLSSKPWHEICHQWSYKLTFSFLPHLSKLLSPKL